MSRTTLIDRRHRILIGAGMTTAVLLLAGCASTPQTAPASLAQAKQAIEIAEKVDANHHATAELDEARQKLMSADKAVATKNIVLADRLALESAAVAELATAKTEAAKAMAVNDEIHRGNTALTEEMQRAGDKQ